MSDFTGKQKAFIEAYLGDARYNAMEAARMAKYSNPRSASQDNMIPGYKVREEIERRLQENLPSNNELLKELTSLALATEAQDWISASDKRKAITDIISLKEKLLVHDDKAQDKATLEDLYSKDQEEDD